MVNFQAQVVNVKISMCTPDNLSACRGSIQLCHCAVAVSPSPTLQSTGHTCNELVRDDDCRLCPAARKTHPSNIRLGYPISVPSNPDASRDLSMRPHVLSRASVTKAARTNISYSRFQEQGPAGVGNKVCPTDFKVGRPCLSRITAHVYQWSTWMELLVLFERNTITADWPHGTGIDERVALIVPEYPLLVPLLLI
jgi:hypothetical protein